MKKTESQEMEFLRPILDLDFHSHWRHSEILTIRQSVL